MKNLGKWEVIIMVEPWLDEKGWERIRKRLPKGFKWEIQEAKRRNKKGRAMGGMITGVKKELGERVEKVKKREEREGIRELNIRIGNKTWNIIGVYVNGDMKEKIEEIKEKIEEYEEREMVIIGGDLNARTGIEGGRNWGEEGEDEKRKSKDKVINNEGKLLIRNLEEMGYFILNANIEGDKEGEITYAGGKNGTVIDHVMIDEDTKEKIERMEVGEYIDSDHFPLIVTTKEEHEQELRRDEKKKERKGRKGRKIWEEEEKETFRKSIEEMEMGEGNIEEEMRKMEEKVKKEIERIMEKVKDKSKEEKEWEEWLKRKRELRKELRMWRGGKIREKIIGKRN